MRTDAWRAAAAAGLVLLLLPLLVLAAGCREQAPPEIPAGRLARVDARARSLRALVPDRCRAGVLFQPLPQGEAGLLVLGTGLKRSDTVLWNGHPLKTTFGLSRVLTAVVPRERLASPGQVEVTVENTLDRSSAKLSARFEILP